MVVRVAKIERPNSGHSRAVGAGTSVSIRQTMVLGFNVVLGKGIPKPSSIDKRNINDAAIRFN